MDILSSITNIHPSRGEATHDLLLLSPDYLSSLRTCLFEECRANNLSHSKDVMVERRGETGCPRNCVLSEDVILLAFCFFSKQGTSPSSPHQEWKAGLRMLNSKYGGTLKNISPRI